MHLKYIYTEIICITHVLCMIITSQLVQIANSDLKKHKSDTTELTESLHTTMNFCDGKFIFFRTVCTNLKVRDCTYSSLYLRMYYLLTTIFKEYDITRMSPSLFLFFVVKLQCYFLHYLFNVTETLAFSFSAAFKVNDHHIIIY